MTTLTAPSLPTRILIGSAIGLCVALFFIIAAHGGRPEWSPLWVIRPILVLTFAGAMGGLCNYLIMHYRWMVGLPKILTIIASLFVFIFGIWMGIVLGFVGTLWH